MGPFGKNRVNWPIFGAAGAEKFEKFRYFSKKIVQFCESWKFYCIIMHEMTIKWQSSTIYRLFWKIRDFRGDDFTDPLGWPRKFKMVDVLRPTDFSVTRDVFDCPMKYFCNIQTFRSAPRHLKIVSRHPTDPPPSRKFCALKMCIYGVSFFYC